MNLNPRHLDLMDWADTVSSLLSQSSTVQKLENPEDWQAWGLNLINQSTLSNQTIPDPRAFDSWIDWAERLNNLI